MLLHARPRSRSTWTLENAASTGTGRLVGEQAPGEVGGVVGPVPPSVRSCSTVCTAAQPARVVGRGQGCRSPAAAQVGQGSSRVRRRSPAGAGPGGGDRAPVDGDHASALALGEEAVADREGHRDRVAAARPTAARRPPGTPTSAASRRAVPTPRLPERGVHLDGDERPRRSSTRRAVAVPATTPSTRPTHRRRPGVGVLARGRPPPAPATGRGGAPRQPRSPPIAAASPGRASRTVTSATGAAYRPS